VIDPKSNFVEHPEVVAQRIEAVVAAMGERVIAGVDYGFGGVVRLTYRGQKNQSGMRDHTAATAFRHSLAASARKIRSVDRETRWR
jgi:hypothetical protein